MSWSAIASAIGQAAMSPDPGAAIAATPDQFSPHQPISVAPVGVNLGEIIKEMNSGSATNGGQPISIPYNLGWTSQATESGQIANTLPKNAATGSQDASLPLALIAVGSVALAVIWRVMR